MKKQRKKHKKTLTPKRRVLIVCEGQTEKNYFEGLKVSPEFREKNAIKLEVINPKKNDAVGLVETAIRQKQAAIIEGNAFEHVWVNLDKDRHANLSRAFDKCTDNGIGIAFSSIAFEYWFLLHFTKVRKAFESGSELERYLTSNYWRNYHKTKLDHYKILREQLPEGLKNAPWLRDQMQEDFEEANGMHVLNPYVTVDKLVSDLLEG